MHWILLLTEAGQIKMIRGAGMPSYRHHHPGNMYITFDIEFPSTTPPMNDQQRATLKSILGLSATVPSHSGRADANGMDVDNEPDLELDALAEQLPQGVQEDDCDLEDVDHSGQQRAQRATMEDDDEDGMPHGAERMQCASQ